MTETRGLTGLTIAATRPAGQVESLCRLIEAQGGRAVPFPTIEILAAEQSQQITSIQHRLHLFDIAIFVSVNAVEGAARLIKTTLPSGLILAAVGNATRIAIEQQWQQTALHPGDGANSEALLQLTELQDIQGRKVLIFRGQGGRELIADTLRQRGATVEYAEVYRRARPTGDLMKLQTHTPAIDLITATSNAILQNIYDMANPAQLNWLLTKQLFVISERAANLAQQLGFQQAAIISEQRSDQGIINAMLAWRSNLQHNNH